MHMYQEDEMDGLYEATAAGVAIRWIPHDCHERCMRGSWVKHREVNRFRVVPMNLEVTLVYTVPGTKRDRFK